MEDRNYEHLDTERGGQMVKDANGYLYWKSAEKRNTNGETRIYWRCIYFQKGPNGEKETACKGFGLLCNNVFRVTTNHSHEPYKDAAVLKEFKGRVRSMAKSNTDISARTVLERVLDQQKDKTPTYTLGDIKDDVVERNIRRYRKNVSEEAPIPESLDDLIIQEPYLGHHNQSTSGMGNYQKDLRLMEAVRKYPQLYDKSHREYLNQVRKGPVWDRVAQEAGFDDTKSAQNRWHSIRAAYQASYKRSQSRSDGEGATYVYAEELAFLNWSPEEKPANDSWLSLLGNQNSAAPSYEDYDEKPSTHKMNGFVENPNLSAVDPVLLSVFDPKPKSDGEWHQFGSHVGSFLARLPDNRKKRELCIKIEQLMLEYEPDS